MTGGPLRSAYDVVVVGGGHNSLVAAAYLGRAGRSVCLLEQGADVGGTVATETLPGGFKGPTAYPSVETFHPGIAAELRLREHGLRLLPVAAANRVLLPDGGALDVPAGTATADGLRGQGLGADVDALAEFRRFFAAVAGALASLRAEALPRLEGAGLRDRVGLLDVGWRLRRLGSPDALEALRFLPMNLRDVLDERFASEALKVALAWPAFSGSWLGPRSAGSALSLLWNRPPWSGGLLAAPVLAEGGPGGLTRALRGAAEAAGVEILTGTGAGRIEVAQGRAVAVVTVDGLELRTPVVVSGVDPRVTLLDLVPPGWLDPEIARAIRNIRGRGTVAVASFAVERLPEGLRDGGGPPRLTLASSLDEVERAFDGVKYGDVPVAPVMEVTVPSAVDATLAPPGGHVVVAWLPFVPHRVREGTWSGHRDGLLRAIRARIDAHLPGFSDRVTEAALVTPHDIEARFAIPGGCLTHAETTLDQMLYMRPLPGWYRYATPVEGLYLCGPSAHPGGGVTGLPGKHAAARVLADRG